MRKRGFKRPGWTEERRAKFRATFARKRKRRELDARPRTQVAPEIVPIEKPRTFPLQEMPPEPTVPEPFKVKDKGIMYFIDKRTDKIRRLRLSVVKIFMADAEDIG